MRNVAKRNRTFKYRSCSFERSFFESLAVFGFVAANLISFTDSHHARDLFVSLRKKTQRFARTRRKRCAGNKSALYRREDRRSRSPGGVRGNKCRGNMIKPKGLKPGDSIKKRVKGAERGTKETVNPVVTKTRARPGCFL